MDELERHYVVSVSIARELKNLPEHLTRIVERDEFGGIIAWTGKTVSGEENRRKQTKWN